MSRPSLACDAVNGEGITAARSAGAGFERYAAGDFFWQPVSRVPRPGGPGLFPIFSWTAPSRAWLPDAQGRRFADEAGSYHHFVEAMVRHLQRTGGDAAWLVCDAAFVHKYGLGVILPGTRRLDRWIRQGYVCVADRLPALAQRAGIDPAGCSPPCSGPTTMLQLAVTRTSTRAMRRSTGSTATRPTDRTFAWAKSANRPSSRCASCRPTRLRVRGCRSMPMAGCWTALAVSS